MINENELWHRRDRATSIDHNEIADFPSGAIMWIFAGAGAWMAIGLAMAAKYLC